MEASRMKPKLFSIPLPSFPHTSPHGDLLLQTHTMAFYSISPPVILGGLLYIPQNPTLTSNYVYALPTYVSWKRLCLPHIYVCSITVYHTMPRNQQVLHRKYMRFLSYILRSSDCQRSDSGGNPKVSDSLPGPLVVS